MLSGEIDSLTVMTAMQNDTEEGWVTAASTTGVAVGYENLTVPTGTGNVLLRYVRISASTASPTSDAALFTLRGMARRNG